MAAKNTFIRRHILWVGLLAVVVPLLIILYLQYVSLVNLEKTSGVARKVWLKDYLYSVASDVQDFYKSKAAAALDVPNTVFSGDRLYEARHYFENADGHVAKRFFVLGFDKKDMLDLYLYDPATRTVQTEYDPESPEWKSVRVTSAPWALFIRTRSVIDSPALVADDRDPDNRMVLRPITDDSSRMIGLAGMIVDPVWFRDRYLPQAIDRTLPKFFSESDRENVIVTVHDSDDKLLHATQPVNWQEDEVRMPLQFIFTDWYLGIRSRDMTVKEWASWNFAVNLSLLILMASVLVGGIVLALRTASREMKLSQMKTDFVSNVSHELRTPLSSIRVFGEFLKLGRVRDSDKVREYGRYIENESRRLSQLINNILDFSKIESGRKTYQFEQASVEEVIRETLRSFEVRLSQSGITVRLEPAPHPFPTAVIDPAAIAQAFVNLLDNAIKYSGDSKEIVVRLGYRDGHITVSVADNGIGIPREEQTRVFERFHRVGTGLVHDVKGSGLGLSIVKHIVQAHRGRVAVESEPNRGSTFTIHIPAAEGGAGGLEAEGAKQAEESESPVEIESQA